MKNPYKELSPYAESDAYSFKGRSVEISEMYESFDRHEYLVCHADSGEGKSSIIEAGLIPKMKANCYFPIRIIFKSDEHFKNKDVDFDKVICGIINNEIDKLRSNKSISVDVVYPKRLANSNERKLTDWEQHIIDSYAWLKLRYARITVDNLLYTTVLIFDQFEEVFTNPPSQEWTDKFFAWLQDLSMDLCPQRIINELEKHVNDDAFPEIDMQKHFKAIFSLRSEYVGKLDYWGLQRHYIPLLKNNRYLLRPLTIKGAKEVITLQEGYDGLNVVADEIIDILRKQQKGKNYVMDEASELPCIPALFLSIICSRAFDMSQEERAAFMQRLVAEKDEDKDVAVNSLIEGFYEKAVAECGIPSKDMGIIEDVLINNEGSRQRVSSHADVLKAIDFSTKYMEKLKDVRLIRVIPEYNREEESIEFVHDALCPIIAKRKEQRIKKIEEQAAIDAERANKLKSQREDFVASYMIIPLSVLITIFLGYVFQSIETAKNLRAFDTVFVIVIANLSILPILIYSSVKKLKITSWLSVYGIISNAILMFLFRLGQTKEMGLRWGLAAISIGIPLITFIYSFKFKLWGIPQKKDFRTIVNSIPLLLFFWIIASFVFYLCVFNKTFGLPEPFNSSWGIFVIPLLSYLIISNIIGLKLKKIAFVEFCSLLGLLTYNTSVVPFAFHSYAILTIGVATLLSLIWSYKGLNWGKKVMVIVLNLVVLITILILNLGFNVAKIKYDAVSHVFNWVDVTVRNQNDRFGVVSACYGDTILPCVFDSINPRQHFAFINSNKIVYENNVIDYKSQYKYKKDSNSALWKCLFIDEVENNISKYSYNRIEMGTLLEDTLRFYAAKVYHEVRNANIMFFTKGKMYSLGDLPSIDTLVGLQSCELTNILNELSSHSTETLTKSLDISQVVTFNKAFARSFYLLMLKDRILQKDSVNIFNLTLEILSLYFYDAGSFKLTTNFNTNLNIGSFYKTYSSTIKTSDLRDNTSDLRNTTLDSWYNYVIMLLNMDMGSNAEDYVRKKTRRYMDILNNLQSIHEKMNQDSDRNIKKMSTLLQKGDKLDIGDLKEALDIYKKQLDLANDIKNKTNTQIDMIELEKKQIDLDFQRLIDDVYSTLSHVIMNSSNIYNSAFIGICEKLYLISELRQYEIAPVYLRYLEEMNQPKNKLYSEFRKSQEKEDSLKQAIKDFRFK